MKGNLELGDKVWFDTNKDGKYLFTGLTEGDYTVYFNTPAGMIPTGLNVGNDTLDSDGSVVTVHLTDNNYTIDSGFYTSEGGDSTEPGTPSEPGTPIEPGTPETHKTSQGTPNKEDLTSSPDTGENNNGGALAALLAGLGRALLYRRKNKKMINSGMRVCSEPKKSNFLLSYFH
ncbi:hypothetical protein BHU61_09970 [Macrococcus epidermidis]|uniref:Gram-positive cocci surface proteins LPxTG domain-containing protein n=1 Tax=Macrococcus epidermidis TaxID=1902580 RepID=A0A327ZP13_9STAP|nr:SdrD B-like domain-containing protein [Macrococcus epidermidis]RAK44093.1 hypothetical protein BHU61_09970 [Macrococcus epidermidis]